MRVLIIRFSAIGDVLLVTGPLRVLKQQLPELEVHLLTSETGAELFQNSVDVDKVFVLPKGSGIIDSIRSYSRLGKYDVVLDLQGKLNSYLVRLLRRSRFYTLDKQSRARRAFAKNRRCQDQLTQHVAQKYYALFRKAFNLPEVPLEKLRPYTKVKPLSFDGNQFNFAKAIVVHPYASQKNKVWPYFSELIEKLATQGHPVVVIGQQSDETINMESENILDLTNKTSLNEMSSLIATAKAVISTDSGPMHMAIAQSKPTLALFGPTTKEFGFYPEFSNSFVIENQALDCRPCHVHGGNKCPLEHHLCMRDISVEEVLEKLKMVL